MSIWNLLGGTAFLFSEKQTQQPIQEPPLNFLARLGKVTIELPDGQIITAEHLSNDHIQEGE